MNNFGSANDSVDKLLAEVRAQLLGGRDPSVVKKLWVQADIEAGRNTWTASPARGRR